MHKITYKQSSLALYKFQNDLNEPDLDFLENIYSDRENLKKVIAQVISQVLKTSADRPFEGVIEAGQKIVLKPNWVLEMKLEHEAFCLTTQFNIIYAILELVLLEKPRKVVIADSPIQSCCWSKVVTEDVLQEIGKISGRVSTEIEVKDWRRVVMFDGLHPVEMEKPWEDYIVFDLAQNSILENITSKSHKFRITCYPHTKLAETHSPGMHKYCIAKDIFDADCIISIPKAKSHQKTGLTCALKNFVGVNGDKNFLPHHRFGGIKAGGDCYPGGSKLRKISEHFYDKRNKNLTNKFKAKMYAILGRIFWTASRPTQYHQLAAGWYGNDTCWRMVHDLNNIVHFGKIDGTLSDTPVRKVFSFVDGIIAGQGNGPLSPEPLPLGIISFSNNVALTDLVIAELMEFDPEKIALVKKSCEAWLEKDFDLSINGKQSIIKDLSNIAVPAKPAPGWVGHIEK